MAFLVQDRPVLVPDEIYIAYGLFISRGLTVDAKQPVNVFGQVEEGLDELAQVGRRVLMNGAETVRFTLAGAGGPGGPGDEGLGLGPGTRPRAYDRALDGVAH